MSQLASEKVVYIDELAEGYGLHLGLLVCCQVFPVDVLREAASLGLAGLYVPEEYGGSGLGRLDGALVFEGLSYGDISTAAYLTIHNMVRECGQGFLQTIT